MIRKILFIATALILLPIFPLLFFSVEIENIFELPTPNQENIDGDLNLFVSWANPLPLISRSIYLDVLNGQISNWSSAGGSDEPIVFYWYEAMDLPSQILESKLFREQSIEISMDKIEEVFDIIPGAFSILSSPGPTKGKLLPIDHNAINSVSGVNSDVQPNIFLWEDTLAFLTEILFSIIQSFAVLLISFLISYVISLFWVLEDSIFPHKSLIPGIKKQLMEVWASIPSIMVVIFIYLLQRIGLLPSSGPWPGIWAFVILSTPILVSSHRRYWQRLPENYVEGARILGLSFFERFRWIVLPNLPKGLLVASSVILTNISIFFLPSLFLLDLPGNHILLEGRQGTTLIALLYQTIRQGNLWRIHLVFLVFALISLTVIGLKIKNIKKGNAFEEK